MAIPTNTEQSTGDIVQNVMRDVGEVVRGEVRLVKAEFGEKASKAGKAGGFFGAAALCGIMGFACLTLAADAALALAMAVWAAALIVGFALLCFGAAAYFGGKAKMKNLSPVPEKTVQTIKDDIQWAKHRTT
jgi:hypothetical protein